MSSPSLPAALSRVAAALDEALRAGLQSTALARGVQRAARGAAPDLGPHDALAWRLTWWLSARAPSLDPRYIALGPMHVAGLVSGSGTWRDLLLELSKLEHVQRPGTGATALAALWTHHDEALGEWVRGQLHLDVGNDKLAELADAAEDKALAAAEAGVWDAVPLGGPDAARIRAALASLPRESAVEVVRNWQAASVEASRGAFDRAMPFADKAIAAAPELFEGYLRRASHRFGLGDRIAAGADLERALALHPTCATARAMRAELRAVIRDLQGSLEDWKVAVSEAPGLAAFHLGMASTLVAMGQHEAADAAFARAIALAPDDPSPRYSRADNLVRQGKLEAAVRAYDEVIALADEPLVRLNRGTVHMMRKQGHLALKDFDVAVEQQPDNPSAYAKRGHALVNVGRPAAAWLDLLTGLALAEVDWSHREQVQGVLSATMQRFDQGSDGRPAVAAAQERVRLLMTQATRAVVSRFADLLDTFLPYEDPGFHLLRAELLQGAARWAEAAKAWKDALAGDDSLAVAWLGLGRAQVEAGDLEAAGVALTKARGLAHALSAEQTFELHLTDARRLGAGGALAEAVSAFDAALALQPDRADVWFYKGVHLDLDKRPQEAVAAYDESIARDASFAPAWFNRACERALLGDRDKALSDLSHAIALDPSWAEAAKTESYFASLHGAPDFVAVLALGDDD